VTISERGIELDPKLSNFLYDTDEGFGAVDYHSSKIAGKDSADQKLGDIVGWMATVIAESGDMQLSKPDKTSSDYEKQLDIKKANYEVLQRFSTLANKKLTGDDREVAKDMIDATLSSLKKTVTNEHWAAERVAQDVVFKKQQEKMISQSSSDGWNRV
jgi:hypothetical protein